MVTLSGMVCMQRARLSREVTSWVFLFASSKAPLNRDGSCGAMFHLNIRHMGNLSRNFRLPLWMGQGRLDVVGSSDSFEAFDLDVSL
eukprot:scaffold91755_cov18-Prasinocladus_malaysianus.AAC.2